jgi:hypothetical protein
MKNSSDTMGNRTRDLPDFSTVPQPTVPLRALPARGTVPQPTAPLRAPDPIINVNGSSNGVRYRIISKLLDIRKEQNLLKLCNFMWKQAKQAQTRTFLASHTHTHTHTHTHL